MVFFMYRLQVRFASFGPKLKKKIGIRRLVLCFKMPRRILQDGPKLEIIRRHRGFVTSARASYAQMCAHACAIVRFFVPQDVSKMVPSLNLVDVIEES